MPRVEPQHAVDLSHPLLVALRPLLERVEGVLVPAADAGPDDVRLEWEGVAVAAVRLPGAVASAETVADLHALLDDVTRELGAPLEDLDRAGKQHAVRMLEDRGAFQYRKSAETVAEALGVTRFTVYNYLNRARS